MVKGNSYLAKLNAAKKQVIKEKPKTASNILNAFMNKVEADIKTGKIPSEDGNRLIDAANAVIEQLDDDS